MHLDAPHTLLRDSTYEAMREVTVAGGLKPGAVGRGGELAE